MKKKYSEEAPTNSTGPTIPGTGSDVAHWKKKKKKSNPAPASGGAV